MSNDGYQKELFEEFHEKPRKSFTKLESFLPKADFEGKVSITLGLEKAVFISIGIILIMIIVFAMGVERGRTIAADETSKNRDEKMAAITPPVVSASIQPVPSQVVAGARAATATPVSNMKGAPSVQPKAEPEDLSQKPYTIIAMTFRERETAVQAANWLKKEGFQSYQKQDGQFFPVCVGSYSSKAAAQAELSKIKRLCKDAYIKTRQ